MKTYIITLFLFTSFFSNAQISGKVIDSITKKPIPYVNIWIENESEGTSSEEDGSFKFSKDHTSKTIIFSAIGYETKKIARNSISETIELNSQEIMLDEIVINSNRKTIEKVVGEFKKSKINFFFSASNKPKIRARYFPYDSLYVTTPFIKKIKIDTDSNVENAKFNIRLYTIGEDGKPGEYLYDKNIFGYAKRGYNKLTEVDISDLNILFPEKGFFIAFEWLIIKENQYEYKGRTLETKKKYKGIRYAPNVGITPSLIGNSWTLDGGVWKDLKKIGDDDNHSKIYRNKYPVLAIELTLTN